MIVKVDVSEEHEVDHRLLVLEMDGMITGKQFYIPMERYGEYKRSLRAMDGRLLHILRVEKDL